MDRNKILEDIEEIFEICQERNIGSNETELDIRETITDYIVKKLTLTDVVSSFITAEDEGKCFVVNTDYDDEIEKGSTVYLLRTYPEDVHLFTDKNGDEVWISADDVDRKE